MQYAMGQFSLGANFRYRSILKERFDDGFDLTLNFDDRFTNQRNHAGTSQVFRNEKMKSHWVFAL